MVLFKLFGFIEINYQIIIVFILGIVLGIELFLLIYALLFVLSLRNKKISKLGTDDTEVELHAKNLILKARESLNDKTLRGKDKKTTHFVNLTKDLIYGISAIFYPKSKHPQLELTIEEAINLLSYIQIRLNEIFDKKVVKLFKKMKISFIYEVTNATRNVVTSKTFQGVSKAKKATDRITSIISLINPFKWGTKLISKLSLSIIKNKIYDVSLEIVGEEAYKIYSKSVLNKELTLESDLDNFESELEGELSKIKTDIKNKEENDENGCLISYNMKTRIYKGKNIKNNDNLNNPNLDYKTKTVLEA